MPAVHDSEVGAAVLAIALRCTAGVYNNDTFVWYDFKMQRFALAADFVVGYSFIF